MDQASKAKTNPKTLRDYLRIVFRRKGLFLISCGVFLVAGLLISAFALEPRYTGQAKLLHYDDAALQELAPTDQRGDAFEMLKRAIKTDLTGDNAIRDVIHDLKLTVGFPVGPDGMLDETGKRMEYELIRKVADNVEISFLVRQKGLNVILVRYTDSDPDVTQNMVNALVNRYVTMINRRLEDNLKERYEYLRQQLTEAEQRYKKQKDKLIKYETEHQSQLDTGPSGVVAKLEAKKNEIENLKRQIDIARAKLAVEQARLSQPAPGERTIEQPDPQVQARIERLTGQIEALQQQRDLLIADGYKEIHPTIKDIDRRLAMFHKRLEEAKAELNKPVKVTPQIDKNRLSQLTGKIESLQAELAVLQTSLQRANNELKKLTAEAAGVTVARQKYAQMLEEQELQRKRIDEMRNLLNRIYNKLREKLAGHGLRLKLEEPCPKLYKPSWPNAWMVFAAVIIGAVGLSLGLVVVAEIFDRSFRTVEEAMEHFKVPVLGAVCEIVTPTQRRRRRILKAIALPIGTMVFAILLAGSSVLAYVRFENPTEYQKLTADPIGYIGHRIGK